MLRQPKRSEEAGIKKIIALMVLALLVSACANAPAVIAAPTGAAAASAPNATSPLAATNAPVAANAPSTPASVIFYNANVLTMDKAQPTAEAVALLDDKILAVGSTRDILALKGPDTQAIDLQGLTLMPGIVDSHTHLLGELNSPLTGSRAKAQELGLENGITTVGNLFTDGGFLQEMQALDASGELRLRTSLYLTYSDACGKVLGDWYKQVPPTHTPGEMLRIAGVKVYTDGGSCGHAAVSWDRAAGGRGDLWFTQEQLNKIVSDVDAAGYQIAIHAIGDRAANEALNSIEYTLHGRPNVLRHRIEHNVTVRPEDLPRYQQLGVVATLQGNVWSCKDVFWSHGIVPDPPEYRSWNFPFRALLDANPNGHFAWHSDFPWASINPFSHLYSMVTPNEIAGDLTECPDPSWIGNKTLTLDEALRMMTIEGAYAMFRDTEVGSLVPGKYADLIIISGNPATDLNAIRNIKVWMTMVGGKVEWCAPGHEALCPSAPGAQPTTESPLAGPVKIRLQMQTTSDWATLNLSSGGTLVDANVVSASVETTHAVAGGDQLSMNQPLDRANSGGSVEMIVDATLTDAHTAAQLEFDLQGGAIGDTTVTLFNYLGATPVEVATFVMNGTNKSFKVPVSKFLAP